MPSDSGSATLSPFQRDLFIAIVAVGLVTAPFWIGIFGFGESIYVYERSAVTAEGEALEYEDDPSSPFGPVPVSDEIACSAGIVYEVRTCALEAHLAENEPVETGIRTSDPGNFSPPFEEVYRYIRIDDTIYEAAYTGVDNGRTVSLDLEPADPDAVLEDVSIPADRNTVPEAVREAAETGEAETRSEIDVPQTPIETDDGSYYRVYQVALLQPPSIDSLILRLANFGGPIVGLLLVYHLSQRITYVESVKRDDQ